MCLSPDLMWCILINGVYSGASLLGGPSTRDWDRELAGAYHKIGGTYDKRMFTTATPTSRFVSKSRARGTNGSTTKGPQIKVGKRCTVKRSFIYPVLTIVTKARKRVDTVTNREYMFSAPLQEGRSTMCRRSSLTHLRLSTTLSLFSVSTLPPFTRRGKRSPMTERRMQ